MLESRVGVHKGVGTALFGVASPGAVSAPNHVAPVDIVLLISLVAQLIFAGNSRVEEPLTASLHILHLGSVDIHSGEKRHLPLFVLNDGKMSVFQLRLVGIVDPLRSLIRDGGVQLRHLQASAKEVLVVPFTIFVGAKPVVAKLDPFLAVYIVEPTALCDHLLQNGRVFKSLVTNTRSEEIFREIGNILPSSPLRPVIMNET